MTVYKLVFITKEKDRISKWKLAMVDFLVERVKRNDRFSGRNVASNDDRIVLHG